MPLFRFNCCRHGVENQVEKSAAPPKKDAAYESDVKAVQYMRDRSKQRSHGAEESQNVMVEENDDKEDGRRMVTPVQDESEKISPTDDANGAADAEKMKDESSPVKSEADEEVIDHSVSLEGEELVSDGSHTKSDDTKDDSIGSDADAPSTRERYDKAVKLLHRSMPETQKPLTSSEREFLYQLLNKDVSASEERIMALENAQHSLSNDLFEEDAPSSPSRSAQECSRPKQPEYRGVKLSIVKSSLHTSTSGEAFELMIRNSNSIDEDEWDAMDVDDPPLLVVGK